MLRKVSLLAVSIWFSLNSSIFAYQEEEEAWEPLSAGPLTTWTAPLCGKGKFVLQPFFFYNRTRGTFSSGDRYNSLPGDERKFQFQKQLFMQYGLSDEWELDAQIVRQDNYAKQSDRKAHSAGFGDSYLFLRDCLLEEKGPWPHLAGVFQLKLPTGKYQKLDPDKLGTDSMGAGSGGGSYDLGLGVNITKKLKPFVLHADAIYNFPQERKIDGLKTEYGRYLNYDFGLEYFLPRGFNLMVELNGFLQADKRQEGEKLPASDIYSLTFSPGIGWSNDKIQTLLAYQRTFIGANTDANDSVVVTFVYTF